MDKNRSRLDELYNLILKKGTRQWEREQLLKSKHDIEANIDEKLVLAQLEYKFRPLAVRHNLSPDVADFYTTLIGQGKNIETFDVTRHFENDPVGIERAIFAGGCFWCMVEPFETRPGIIAVISGYTGGTTPNPTYDEVLIGSLGYVEAVEIIFDATVVTYNELCQLYWQLIDPTDEFGQFGDRGANYRAIIYVVDEKQRKIAEESKFALECSKKFASPIVVPIIDAVKFWPAENFHQQFYRKNHKQYQRLKNSRKTYLTYLKIKGWFWRKIRR